MTVYKAIKNKIHLWKLKQSRKVKLSVLGGCLAVGGDIIFDALFISVRLSFMTSKPFSDRKSGENLEKAIVFRKLLLIEMLFFDNFQNYPRDVKLTFWSCFTEPLLFPHYSYS